ncbi:hypothetical protein HCJ76_19080 [Streptomyces sp. MC1]|uniref:hypothetical protein n=1 Tax=Streptomyces sp. MC1 TaxID=295105 RepID=UPI0018CA3FC3|nr:hypothetical protein [Streptomyces sp. MC1]MBG7700128.1 hypothetical protein [Streptomyces sp. MC1]
MIRRGTGRRGGHSDRHAATRLTVSRARDHVHLVHSGGTPPGRLTDISEWLGPARPNEAVVLVGAALGEEGVEGLCERLAPVLQESKEQDVRLLRLVMSAGADEAEGRPSTARLICERWELDVLATAGPAVVVPDGTLFSPDLPDAPGGWWHFSVGQVPRSVGSRLPIPDWESALRRLEHSPVPGHVVEPVPAGLMIRPAGAASAAVDTLPYAVAPDPDRPHLLIDAPNVPAAGLATMLAALPGRVRKDIRLVSLDGRSMLETGQAVADLLGTGVQVANGVPVVVDGDAAGDDAAGESSTELYMVDADGTPTWRPFAQAFVCEPGAEGREGSARVTEWRAPAALLEGTDPRGLPFDQTWKVALTPAGLWAGPRGSEPPLVAATRTADPDAVAIELGAPRRAIDDSLWPGLDRLFGELGPEVRERAVVHVHGVLGSKGMENLRRLTIRHNFSLMPQAPGEAEPPAAEVFPSLGRPARRTGAAQAAEAEFDLPDREPGPEVPAGAGELVTETRSSDPDPAPVPEPVPAQVPGGPRERVRPSAAASPSSVPGPSAVPAPVPAERASLGPSGTPTGQPSVPSTDEAAAGDVEVSPVSASPVSASPVSASPVSAASGSALSVPAASGSAATVGNVAASLVGGSVTRESEAFSPAVSGSVAPGGEATASLVGGSVTRESEAFSPAASGSAAPGGDTTASIAGGPAAPRGGGFEAAASGAAGDGAVPPAPGSRPDPVPRAVSRARGTDTPAERGTPDTDHAKLRAQLGPFWEQHRAAVAEITGRLFKTQPRDQSDAAIAELVAVHVYMTAVDDARLRAALADGDEQSRTLLRCLRSGTRRLPSYRGAVMSTAGELVQRLTPDAVGEEWEGTVPVRGVSVGRTYPGPAADHLLIWSVTGRRTGTRADDDNQDILFARESRFRVLGVVRHGPATVGLLQEMPQQAHTSSPHLDAALLNRLRAALDLPAAPHPGEGHPPETPSRAVPFPTTST